MIKTFNQFKKLGLGIKKGEKSISRDSNGKAVFSIRQTLPICEPEEPEVGQLSEQEIQELYRYRQMMKGWVRDAASRGNAICGAYLAFLDSHPLAKQIDEDLDWSDDASDIEMHY